MKKQLGIFCMIGALLWMAMIFGFSGDSGKVSSKQSNNLLVTLKLIDKDELQKQYYKPEVKMLRVMIRKFAHLALYTALGGLLFIGFKGLLAFATQRAIGMTFILAGIFAVTDEIHQYFVPGRAARIEDVFIDLSGVAVGMAACMILMITVRQLHRAWLYLTTEETETAAESSEPSSAHMA